MRFNKFLCGLEKAARSWHLLSIITLRKLSFELRRADLRISHFFDALIKTLDLFLHVHVDHMIVAGSKENCIWLQEILSNFLPAKTPGPLTRYCGYTLGRDVGRGSVKIA